MLTNPIHPVPLSDASFLKCLRDHVQSADEGVYILHKRIEISARLGVHKLHIIATIGVVDLHDIIRHYYCTFVHTIHESQEQFSKQNTFLGGSTCSLYTCFGINGNQPVFPSLYIHFCPTSRRISSELEDFPTAYHVVKF